MSAVAQKPEALTVRLLIFSGRPDPEWDLGAEELKGVLEGVRAVAAGEDANPPPTGGLGYRGFLLEGPALAEVRTEAATVFRGVVTMLRGQKGTHRRDTGDLERTLLRQARDRGYGDILDAAGAPQ
jgi:hypothetical protein